MLYDIDLNPAPEHVEESGHLFPVSLLESRGEYERLATHGLYRLERETGDAPLGYEPPVLIDGALHQALSGTPEEREAAALQQAREQMSCTDLQALLALDQIGLAEAYEAWSTDPARTFAERAFINKAKTWKRLDPTFNAAADSFEKSEAEKDAFFALAVTL